MLSNHRDLKVFLDSRSVRKLALGLTAAIEVVIYTMSGYAVGWFLDHRVLHSYPWGIAGMTFVGFGMGAYRLFLLMSKDYGKPDDPSDGPDSQDQS